MPKAYVGLRTEASEFQGPVRSTWSGEVFRLTVSVFSSEDIQPPRFNANNAVAQYELVSVIYDVYHILAAVRSVTTTGFPPA